MSEVIVIGAGISGLATAALLAREGHSVRIIEAREQLGGRAGRWEADGFSWDTGPSWYLMPEVYDHFFRLFGTTAEAELDLAPLTPAYRVFSEGQDAFDIVSDPAATAAQFDVVEPGAGAALTRYLRSAAEAYDLAVKHFLYESYSSWAGLVRTSILSRLPRLATLLTRTLHDEVGAHVSGLPLRQVLEYPAVLLGGSPFQVPALYHLMSHVDITEGVLYPRGGMWRVVEALEKIARENGVQIRTSAPVARILLDGKRARSIRLENGEILDADIIVSTADLHHTEQQLLRRKPPRRERTPSPGAVLVLLGVRGELPELAHHNLLLTSAWQENFDQIFGEHPVVPDPASIYVCHPSATDASVAPDGHANLFVLVPVPADPHSGRGGVGGAGDSRIEQVADRIIEQIAQWCEVPDLADRIVVRRTVAPEDFAHDFHAWRGNALGLAHTLGQSAMFRPKNTIPGINGLYLAGTDVLPGIGVPLCLISAEVVTGLIGGRTRGRLAERAAT